MKSQLIDSRWEYKINIKTKQCKLKQIMYHFYLPDLVKLKSLIFSAGEENRYSHILLMGA